MDLNPTIINENRTDTQEQNEATKLDEYLLKMRWQLRDLMIFNLNEQSRLLYYNFSSPYYLRESLVESNQKIVQELLSLGRIKNVHLKPELINFIDPELEISNSLRNRLLSNFTKHQVIMNLERIPKDEKIILIKENKNLVLGLMELKVVNDSTSSDLFPDFSVLDAHKVPLSLFKNELPTYESNLIESTESFEKLKPKDNTEIKSNESSQAIKQEDGHTKAEAPMKQAEVPKAEVPKAEVQKTEVPKAAVSKTEVPKAGVPKTEAPKAAVSKKEVPKAEVPKTKAPKTVVSNLQPVKKEKSLELIVTEFSKFFSNPIFVRKSKFLRFSFLQQNWLLYFFNDKNKKLKFRVECLKKPKMPLLCKIEIKVNLISQLDLADSKTTKKIEGEIRYNGVIFEKSRKIYDYTANDSLDYNNLINNGYVKDNKLRMNIKLTAIDFANDS